MNKEELKNIENHRQDLIKENNTLTNLLEIERKQVGRLAKQLNLSGVSHRSELLLFDEYIYSNESQHDRDRGAVVDRYLAKK